MTSMDDDTTSREIATGIEDDPEAEVEEDDLYDRLMAGTSLPEPPHPVNLNRPRFSAASF